MIEVKEIAHNDDCMCVGLNDWNKGPTHIIFNFRDGTQAVWKTGGDMQEFLDKVNAYHVLQKKFDMAMLGLRDAKDVFCVLDREDLMREFERTIREIENVKE